MNSQDKNLLALLKTEGVTMAEKITGQDYKVNKSTKALGIYSHMWLGAIKDKALREVGDTCLSHSLSDYLGIIKDEGFETCLELLFKDDDKDETLFVFFNTSKGILLVFDTYRGRVNDGRFYYNWLPNSFNWHEYHNFTSSGGFDGGIWVGNHACREALRFNIRMLSEHGQFITPWVKRPFLWLLHHQDLKVKSYDYENINAERIAMFPLHVQKAI